MRERELGEQVQHMFKERDNLLSAQRDQLQSMSRALEVAAGDMEKAISHAGDAHVVKQYYDAVATAAAAKARTKVTFTPETSGAFLLTLECTALQAAIASVGKVEGKVMGRQRGRERARERHTQRHTKTQIETHTEREKRGRVGGRGEEARLFALLNVILHNHISSSQSPLRGPSVKVRETETERQTERVESKGEAMLTTSTFCLPTPYPLPPTLLLRHAKGNTCESGAAKATVTACSPHPHTCLSMRANSTLQTM